jgi:predicted aspartyl protease
VAARNSRRFIAPPPCCIDVPARQTSPGSDTPTLPFGARNSFVKATADVGDPAGARWETLDALVDTGATYTWTPALALSRLGVRPQFRREFVTADGRVAERDMAVTMTRWDGQALPALVVFGDDDSLPLLGAYTMEFEHAPRSCSSPPEEEEAIGFPTECGCTSSRRASRSRTRISRATTAASGTSA